MELQNYCFSLIYQNIFTLKCFFSLFCQMRLAKGIQKSRYTHVPRDPNTYNYMKKPLQASLPLIAITGAKVLLFFEYHNR